MPSALVATKEQINSSWLFRNIRDPVLGKLRLMSQSRQDEVLRELGISCREPAPSVREAFDAAVACGKLGLLATAVGCSDVAALVQDDPEPVEPISP